MLKKEDTSFISIGIPQELKKVSTQSKTTVLNSVQEEQENILNIATYSGWKLICQRSQLLKDYQTTLK